MKLKKGDWVVRKHFARSWPGQIISEPDWHRARGWPPTVKVSWQDKQEWCELHYLEKVPPLKLLAMQATE